MYAMNICDKKCVLFIHMISWGSFYLYLQTLDLADHANVIKVFILTGSTVWNIVVPRETAFSESRIIFPWVFIVASCLCMAAPTPKIAICCLFETNLYLLLKQIYTNRTSKLFNASMNWPMHSLVSYIAIINHLASMSIIECLYGKEIYCNSILTNRKKPFNVMIWFFSSCKKRSTFNTLQSLLTCNDN